MDTADRTPRVRDFAETWFGQMKPEWRPSYQETVLVTLNRYVLPKLGNVRVGSISKADLLDWRAELCAIERPKGRLSNDRINKIIGILRKLLGEAADQYDFSNPALGIKALRKQKSDIFPFTLEEVRLILSTIRPDYQPYLAVRFYTAMRTGEINALQWRDIDWSNGVIMVRNTLYKGELLAGAKTEGSARDIPMIPQVLEALKRQRDIVPRDIEWVFPSPGGKPLDARNFCRRIWAPLLNYLGLPYRRPYQTRHTAATLMLAAGEQPQYVSAIMGHSNSEMLYTTYSRYVRNMTRQDGSAMAKMLDT
jgi:integrase